MSELELSLVLWSLLIDKIRQVSSLFVLWNFKKTSKCLDVCLKPSLIGIMIESIAVENNNI